jgi:hypothetical protein
VTQALVPTLRVPQLSETVAKYIRHTSAILPPSQAQVYDPFALSFTATLPARAQDAAVAAQRFMQV